MNKRALLFRLGAVLVLIAIAACMMVIGRGHTIYKITSLIFAKEN